MTQKVGRRGGEGEREREIEIASALWEAADIDGNNNGALGSRSGGTVSLASAEGGVI